MVDFDRKVEDWNKARAVTPEMLEMARLVLEEIRTSGDVFKTLRKHPLPGGGYLAKHVLVAAYRELVESGEWPADPALLARIRMKPVRSLSGVTTVTVLTKPYPCPGKCIFCPTDVRMPKSYLPDEPGAARAFQNAFDPFDQVRTRLDSYDAVGHPSDKVASTDAENRKTGEKRPSRNGDSKVSAVVEKYFKRSADGTCKVDTPWIKVKFDCSRN